MKHVCSIYLWLTSEEYKIGFRKKKEFEDLKDLLLPFATLLAAGNGITNLSLASDTQSLRGSAPPWRTLKHFAETRCHTQQYAQKKIINFIELSTPTFNALCLASPGLLAIVLVFRYLIH
jgi:hypothetical protein